MVSHIEMTWKQQLKNSYSNIDDLLQFLKLDGTKFNIDKNSKFPFKVTQHFANQIEKKNWNDPLLKQILPIIDEKKKVLKYILDPLSESKANILPGMLQKYSSRVLLIVTKSCAIHCRYCFRKSFNYLANQINKKQWKIVFKYIKKNKEIYEIILSGGDPLMLNDEHIKYFIKEISKISHIKILRIHSRLPVVLPDRLTESLLYALHKFPYTIVLVIHANHANELSKSVIYKLIKYREGGLILLNQSVFLKGINDCQKILSDLSKKLFKAGVLPYYLHILDPVEGVSHFKESTKKAKKIIEIMRKSLPGYLVPRLCKELSGKSSKTILM